MAAHSLPVPRVLRGRVQPPLTIDQVRRRIAYERALNPLRVRVTADEFEQAVYDAVARNPFLSRAQIVEMARKLYEVIDART